MKVILAVMMKLKQLQNKAQKIFSVIFILYTSFPSYNRYKLSLTCFQRGFIAQLVEHLTSIVKVMGLNLALEPQNFFLGFICSCLSYFTTVKIYLFHFYSLSTVHSYDLYHILEIHIILFIPCITGINRNHT